MKKIYTLFAVSFVLFSSCQKEIYFPQVPVDPVVNTPKSIFTVVANGKTYNLNVKSHKADVRDVATLRIEATSPEISVNLDAKALQHTEGVGEYKLICCDNDVFERITNDQQKHWEGDGGGTPGANQNGFIKVTKRDAKSFEGTYSLVTKDGATSNAIVKEFTGSFTIFY